MRVPPGYDSVLRSAAAERRHERAVLTIGKVGCARLMIDCRSIPSGDLLMDACRACAAFHDAKVRARKKTACEVVARARCMQGSGVQALMEGFQIGARPIMLSAILDKRVELGHGAKALPNSYWTPPNQDLG